MVQSPRISDFLNQKIRAPTRLLAKSRQMGQVEYSQVQMGRYCPCFGARKGKKLTSDKEDVLTTEIKPHLSCAFSRESSVITDDHSTSYRVQTFSYRELATATRNFRKDCLLGQGGFGSVYKGKLPGTEEVVAVKQLDQSGFQGDKEFLVEVLMLTLLRHPNLVNLIGYCAEGDQRLLVYEYMPRGSLDDHLHELGPNQDPLDWNTRMMIAAGAAKGLEYLHLGADPPVIYRDIKSSNILLDEGFHPKLSDFGLAKFGPVGDKSHVSTRIMGTQGYCAPEYYASGKLTMKSDIYSFGVFLFELVTGRKAHDSTNGRDKTLVDWVRHVIKDGKSISELVDPLLEGRFSKTTLVKFVEVAFMCIHEKAILRPSINEVACALDYLAAHPYTPKGVKSVGALEADNNGSPKEMLRVLEMEKEREQAVAEAKLWGQTWRERKEKIERNSSIL